MRLVISLLSTILFTGCASQQTVVDSACGTFQPIRASTRDTDETKRQIIGHNRAYEAICPKDAST